MNPSFPTGRDDRDRESRLLPTPLIGSLKAHFAIRRKAKTQPKLGLFSAHLSPRANLWKPYVNTIGQRGFLID